MKLAAKIYWLITLSISATIWLLTGSWLLAWIGLALPIMIWCLVTLAAR